MKEEAGYKIDFQGVHADGFPRALAIAHEGAMAHSGFQHYTTLKVLQSMLKNRTMWLSRLDAPGLNDGNESGKYGRPGLWKRTYVGCYSYGRAESAAMWGMYCASKSDAVRILITPKGMQAWNRYLSDVKKVEAFPISGSNSNNFKCKTRARVEKSGITDVLYAAVKNKSEFRDRTNDLYWNFTHAKIDDLPSWIKNKSVEGFLKDYEWRYEQETRIFVRLASVHQGIAKLALRIPEEVFGAMSIVLSPWMDADCINCYSDRVKKWFRDERLRVPHIRASYLMGTIKTRG